MVASIPSGYLPGVQVFSGIFQTRMVEVMSLSAVLGTRTSSPRKTTPRPLEIPTCRWTVNRRNCSEIWLAVQGLVRMPNLKPTYVTRLVYIPTNIYRVVPEIFPRVMILKDLPLTAFGVLGVPCDHSQWMYMGISCGSVV